MDLSSRLFSFFSTVSLSKVLCGKNISRAVLAVVLKQTRDRQSLKLPGRTDFSNGGVMINPASQSCNDLTVFAVGSMCAEKRIPKQGEVYRALASG